MLLLAVDRDKGVLEHFFRLVLAITLAFLIVAKVVDTLSTRYKKGVEGVILLRVVDYPHDLISTRIVIICLSLCKSLKLYRVQEKLGSPNSEKQGQYDHGHH